MPTLEELEIIFRNLGIDFDRPGFYESSAFNVVEKESPKFLVTYALYVELRRYSPEYIARARRVVRDLSSYLFKQLKRDGKLGACVTISHAFSRMLDEQGIWAYPVNGGVSIDFAEPVGSRHFGAISKPGVTTAGHMWVRVPPFQAIDISLALQPWEGAAGLLLDQVVEVETFEIATPSIYELVDLEFLAQMEQTYGRYPTVKEVLSEHAHLIPFMGMFPSFASRIGDVPVKYVPVSVLIGPTVLELLERPILNGELPKDIYARYVEDLAGD